MPITRNEYLKPISREHHFGLLLCWKIRQGVKKNVAIERIKIYVDWFYNNHLLQHFEIEEKYIFPILGPEHELVIQALSEHRKLSRLFKSKTDLVKNISRIEEELEKHIRFEERILFHEIQETATIEEQKRIVLHHNNHQFIDNNSDQFWL